jgi:hypothetical protein
MQRRGVQGPLLFSMRTPEQRKDRRSGGHIHAWGLRRASVTAPKPNPSLQPSASAAPSPLFTQRPRKRDCMKTPDRCRTGSPPRAENVPTGLYVGVSCYRRATIGLLQLLFIQSQKKNSRKFEVSRSPAVLLFGTPRAAHGSLLEPEGSVFVTHGARMR